MEPLVLLATLTMSATMTMPPAGTPATLPGDLFHDKMFLVKLLVEVWRDNFFHDKFLVEVWRAHL